MMRDYEEMSLPQAVASLLDTPRSLRHALGRTFSAWQTLCGEIDFDHLLAVNVLRFGAPACFLFLVRRWDRLIPPRHNNHHLGVNGSNTYDKRLSPIGTRRFRMWSGAPRLP